MCLHVVGGRRWWCGGGCRNRTILDEKKNTAIYQTNDIRWMPSAHAANAIQIHGFYISFGKELASMWMMSHVCLYLQVDLVFHAHKHTQRRIRNTCAIRNTWMAQSTPLWQTDHCHRYRSVYVFGYFWFLHHLLICSAFAHKTRHAACIATIETTYLFTTPSNQWHFFALFLPVFGIFARANIHTLIHIVVDTRRINFLRLSRARLTETGSNGNGT